MKKILLILMLLVLPLVVKAESLTITATVDDTVLVLNGYTAPFSLVTFKENETVIGTTTSDDSGFFKKKFTDQNSGIHLIRIYSTDPNNQTTITVNQNMTLIQSQMLTLDSIYLPPSINFDNSKVSGYTKPSSLVNVEIVGKTGLLKLISSNDKGYYQIEINSSNFDDGNYTVTSTLQADLSTTSTKSNSLNFTINNINPTKAPDLLTAATLVLSPTPETCPYEFQNLCFFDQGKKGVIETKTELMNYILGFIKYFSQSINNSFDINHDNIVDSTDLSIILFHTKNNESSQQVLSATTTVSNPALNFSVTTKENHILSYLTILFMLEFTFGIPFCIVSIFIIFTSKKYAKK